jgi:signal-transduction protein with cAMP-binding, CBS, and nucleotidyltransferase domain
LCIDTEQLASEALNVFEQKKVSRLVCVEGTTVRGLLGWHDLLQHKVA